MKNLIASKLLAMSLLSIAAVAGPNDTHTENSAEEQCLAMAIYHEARGEVVDGQYAVADVILNRVEDERFPSSICDVIHQPNQFHFRKLIPTSNQSWEIASQVAQNIIHNEIHRGISEGAVYFQRGSRIPPYANERIKKIGNHNFFI